MYYVHIYSIHSQISQQHVHIHICVHTTHNTHIYCILCIMYIAKCLFENFLPHLFHNRKKPKQINFVFEADFSQVSK